MYKISVIIPTFNRANLLIKAIRSALNQTLPPLEVIVCDDGSTDNSEALVNKINDSRVRWVSGPRGGRPAIPRNRGIAQSNGDWLAFLDDDDEWHTDKLELQMLAVKKANSLAACSNAKRLIPTDGIVGDYLSYGKTSIAFEDLLSCNHVICSTVVVHRSIIDSVGGFPEDVNLKIGEDYALWLRVCTKTFFVYINKPLIIYRDDFENSIRSSNGNYYLQRKNVFSNYIEWTLLSKIENSYIASIKHQLRNDLYNKIFLKIQSFIGYFVKKIF